MQTSQEALARFFAAVTEAKQSAATRDVDAGERPEHIRRKLEAAGLV
jgi:hypothetical protein